MNSVMNGQVIQNTGCFWNICGTLPFETDCCSVLTLQKVVVLCRAMFLDCCSGLYLNNVANHIVMFCLQTVGQMMHTDNMKVHYERLTSNLLEWIRVKVLELENHKYPNSLEGIKKELLHFKQYYMVEKPSK